MFQIGQLENISDISITNDAAYIQALQRVVDIREEKYRLEAAFNRKIAEQSEHIKKEGQIFKPMIKICKEAEEDIKHKVLVYRSEHKQPESIPVLSAAKVRRSWDFAITDPAEIPAEFLMVNAAAVKAQIKKTKGKPIPGLDVFEIEGFNITAKKDGEI